MPRYSRILPKLFVVTVGVVAFGCSKKTETAPAAVLPTVVAAPKGLIAEIAIARPDTTWASLRSSIGGPAGMLPSSGALLATTIFDLPPAAAQLFDMEIPALGAVVEEQGRFAAVLALHVKDGPKLAELASTGEAARFTKKLDASSGVLLLSPKEDSDGPALGISGNYLTIAARDGDLTRFAPFVTRTLPTRAVPKEDIVAIAPQAGLAHLVSLAKSEWEEWKSESAAFDAMMRAQLGDAAGSGAQLGYLTKQAERGLEVLEDLDEARLSLSLKDAFVHLGLVATPKPGEGAATRALAAMAPGDAKPLLELPGASVLAVAYRDTKEARAEAVDEQLATIEAGFADKLDAAERTKLAEGLRAWASSRGDWMSLGVLYAGGSASALVRGAVADAAGLDRAISDHLLRFATLPAFSKPIEAILGPYKLTTPSSKPGPKSVRLSRKAGATGSTLLAPEAFPKEVDLAWSVNDEQVVAAVGKDAKTLIAKIPSPKLGESADIAKLVNALEGDVAFALLAQPRKIIAEMTGKTAPEEAPLLLSFGRNGAKEGWIRLDMSQFALRDLAMMTSGF